MDKIAITVDYEFDWGGRIKSAYAIDKMTDKVLKIFDECNAKGTFFISTETAKVTKKNILDIYNAGHEIGSHGHDHNVEYDKLSKDKLDYEISTSKDILENMISDKILGYRTPQFRKNKYTEELLLKNGYIYDSSSVSTNFLDRYKKNQFQDGEIVNFSVSSILGKLPAGVKWINLVGNHIKKDNDVTVIYLHLFDLLTIKEIINLYDKQVISKVVMLFYITRVGSILSTLKKLSYNSRPLKDYL